jgi:hypothetical protein
VIVHLVPVACIKGSGSFGVEYRILMALYADANFMLGSFHTNSQEFEVPNPSPIPIEKRKVIFTVVLVSFASAGETNLI